MVLNYDTHKPAGVDGPFGCVTPFCRTRRGPTSDTESGSEQPHTYPPAVVASDPPA